MKAFSFYPLYLLSCALMLHSASSSRLLSAQLHFCSVDADCQNDGTCVETKTNDGIVERKCQCPHGYIGPQCNRYCPKTCLNGGVCYQNLMDPHAQDLKCKCRALFTGSTCETPYTNCGDGTVCMNGGKCVKDASDSILHSCDCPSGTKGSRCEVVEFTSVQEGGGGGSIGGGAVFGIVAASLVVITAVAWYVRKRRVRYHIEVSFDAVDERIEREVLDGIEIS